MATTYKAVTQTLAVDEHEDYAHTVSDALERGFDAWGNGDIDEFYLVLHADAVQLVTFVPNREVRPTDANAEHSPELRLAQPSILELS